MTQSPSRSCTTAYQAAVSTQVASTPPCRYSGSSLPSASGGRIEPQHGRAVLEAVQREAERGVERSRRECAQLGLGHALVMARRLRRMPSASMSTAPASVSEIPGTRSADREERQPGARDRSRRLALRAAGASAASTSSAGAEREREHDVGVAQGEQDDDRDRERRRQGERVAPRAHERDRERHEQAGDERPGAAERRRQRRCGNGRGEGRGWRRAA